MKLRMMWMLYLGRGLCLRLRRPIVKKLSVLGFLSLMGMLGVGPRVGVAQESTDSNELEASQWQRDYLQLVKDRSHYIEVDTTDLRRDNQETEREWRGQLQIQQQPRLFYLVEGRHWRFTHADPFSPADDKGEVYFGKLGVRYEAKEAAEAEIHGLHQRHQSGVEASYRRFWEPFDWKGSLFLKAPWNDTIVSRDLGGTFQRLSLLGRWIGAQGRWSVTSTTQWSQYELRDESAFQTSEQLQEFVVTRSWFGKVDWGGSYIWERGVVQDAQEPVEVPDRLNHAVLFRVSGNLTPRLEGSLEGTYQYRQIQENEATSVRGELIYDPNPTQRYWVNIESGESETLQGSSNETQWRLGVRINFIGSETF